MSKEWKDAVENVYKRPQQADTPPLNNIGTDIGNPYDPIAGAFRDYSELEAGEPGFQQSRDRDELVLFKEEEVEFPYAMAGNNAKFLRERKKWLAKPENKVKYLAALQASRDRAIDEVVREQAHGIGVDVMYTDEIAAEIEDRTATYQQAAAEMFPDEPQLRWESDPKRHNSRRELAEYEEQTQLSAWDRAKRGEK